MSTRSSSVVARAVLVCILLAAVAGILIYKQRAAGPGTPDSGATPVPAVTGTPVVSPDGTRIVAGGETILPVNHASIVDWFRNESQLCDGANATSTPDRAAFCTDTGSFTRLTRFSSVAVSADGQSVGFTVTSDTLTPDAVAGIFSRRTDTVTMLTDYYLGNGFVGFSPGGTYFIYRSGCFEGMCGLTVKNTDTLITVAGINMPEYADSRAQDAGFVRWVSDSEIEYRLGTDLKRTTF